MITINFVGLRDHTATIYESGHVICSCKKVLDKVHAPGSHRTFAANLAPAYAILERHIRIKLNHQGSLVKEKPNEGK